MKTSITRGRLTELLGESYFEKHDRDNLFIVGVFSLLDAILKMPMDKIMDKIQLPEAVTEALLTREGIYGPFLQLTEACEESDNQKILELAELLQFDATKVNECHIAALAWVETLGI
jgi:EAL and modified HD-GYP domain-containing signal transduction protein